MKLSDQEMCQGPKLIMNPTSFGGKYNQVGHKVHRKAAEQIHRHDSLLLLTNSL